MFNPGSTRLTPKKEYQEPKADQDYTGFLQDILEPRIPQLNEFFKLNDEIVCLQRFAFTLYSEVLESLFFDGYTMRELREDRPDKLHYELIDAINQVVMYGEEINRTFFEVGTKNHFRTVTEIMETISILLED